MAMLNDDLSAVESLKQALRFRPDSADSHYLLATAHARLANTEAARTHYRKAGAHLKEIQSS